MTKFSKFIIKLACILLPVGLIFCLIGVIAGARDISCGKGGLRFSVGRHGISFSGVEEFKYKDEVAPFKNIDVDINNASVKVLPADDDKYFVDMVVFAKEDEVKVEVEGDTLVIKEENSSKLINFVFGMFNIFGDDDADDIVVKIYVPKSVYNEDIELGKVSIDTKNGAVDVKNIKADVMELETSNGSLHIKDVTCTKVKGTTSNGSIDIDDLQTKEASTFKSSNGSIKADHLCFYGETYLKTSNGRIDVDHAALNSTETDLKMGISAHTSNGDVEVNGDDEDDDYERSGSSDDTLLKLKTSNGHIEINY